MGRFAEKHSRAQKDGIAEAVVDGERLYGRRIFPKEAIRMAAAGELHDLPAFEITLSYTQKLASKLRRQRTGREINMTRARGTVEERLEAATAQTLSILEHALDRLERKERHKGLTGQELADLKAVGLVQREIRARQQSPSSGTGQGARKKQPPKEDAAQGRSELVKTLERELRNHEQANGKGEGPADTGAEERGPVPAIA